MARKPQVAESQEVTVRDVAQLPAGPEFMRDRLAQDAGAGTSQNARDVVVPFLYILQANSPQVKKQHEKYIKGAEPGMILNTATGKVWDAVYDEDKENGVLFIPAHYARAEVEWQPNRGGFVAHHPADTPLVAQVKIKEEDGKKLRILPSGNQLVETVYHFGVISESESPAVIAMSSTALQTSRQWMTLRNEFKIDTPNGRVPVPAFSRLYRLNTVWKQNDAGDWFAWKVTDAGWVQNEQHYLLGKAINQQGAKGELLVGRPPDADDDTKLIDGKAETVV